MASFPAPIPSMLCLPPVPPPSSPRTSYLPPPVTPRHHHHTHLPPPPQNHLSLPHFSDINSFLLPSAPRLLAPNPHAHMGPSFEGMHPESPPSPPSISRVPSLASTASRYGSQEQNPLYPSNTSWVESPAASSMASANFVPPFEGAASSVSTEFSRSVVSFNSAHGRNKPMVDYMSAEGSMATLISSSEGEGMETRICVSHTDRETIVHTHSSNFRDVVRQLTGASSEEQDLMPVTLPARLASRVVNNNTGNNSQNAVGVANTEGPGLALRKPPLKLHERRKSSMKNLEKITTVFTHYASELSPLNPSPVTPLASDFERFCNASTPTSQGSSALNSPMISKGKGAMEALSSGASNRKERAVDQPPAAAPCSPLERASPRLLNLFPESPSHSLLPSKLS